MWTQFGLSGVLGFLGGLVVITVVGPRTVGGAALLMAICVAVCILAAASFSAIRLYIERRR